MKLKIGSKEFTTKTADTPENRAKGLLSVKKGSMPKDAALILKYDKPTDVVITMVGMKFPIDVIFVKDNVVQKIICAEVGQENISINDKSDFVVETPCGACNDIKAGDNVEFIGEKKPDGTIEKAEGGIVASEDGMQVLDENGRVQANIEGDERIFSRKHTAKLFELAEMADKTKDDNDYKKLGMAMMRMIDRQDTQEPQYVDN